MPRADDSGGGFQLWLCDCAGLLKDRIDVAETVRTVAPARLGRQAETARHPAARARRRRQRFDRAGALLGAVAAAKPSSSRRTPPSPCDMAPYGYQWFSAQDRSPAAVLAGVRAAAPMLDAFIDEALAERGLDDGDLALVGFSQGHDDVALCRAAAGASRGRHRRLFGPAARARAARQRAALAAAHTAGPRHRGPARPLCLARRGRDRAARPPASRSKP